VDQDLESQELAFKNSLYALLTKQQKEQGQPPASWNPFHWNRMEQINFAVTYGLTAIGLCLLLGFCTPLAALGGAAFMCFVVMTQPAFPGIYPPDLPVVGHALLVNKDFVEMVALLVVSATAAGRWAAWTSSSPDCCSGERNKKFSRIGCHVHACRGHELAACSTCPRRAWAWHLAW